MGIHRLNHAVLYVRDVPTSTAFYSDVLGFRTTASLGEQAVFLRAPDSTNDHDLALFGIGAGAGPSTAGRGALVGSSDHGTTKSLYARDPDGLELELVWIVPAALLDAAAVEAATRIAPLDLEREKARYGADTRGGVGVSLPA